jgi:alanine racemase
MHRLGFDCNDVLPAAKKIESSTNLYLEGVWSHFADSGNFKNDKYSKKQLRKFKTVKKALLKNNIKPDYFHMSNSSGIIRFPEAHFDMVRSGMLIYGYHPSSVESNLKLESALELKSQIAQTRIIDKGEPVGYGLTYLSKKKIRIAVIPVGYKDGYARHLSNKGQVLIRGKKCSIIGRICMRMFMVDVTSLERVAAGDEVVLIGSQLSDRINVVDLSKQIDTIPYEILSRLDKSLTRIYE